MAKITDKQQKFIDCYDGDIKKSAKKAGITYGYARKLGTKRNILTAIRNRIDNEIRPKDISNRQQRQAFWSKVMNCDAYLIRDRLRASELLGKSEMDFPNKMVVTGDEGGPVQIQVVHFDKKKINLGSNNNSGDNSS